MQENNGLPSYSPEEIEQLINTLEEVLTENEQFRVQIQILSSDRRKLSEQVQRQMSQIQRQAEQIERLNGSDLELKKAEKLKKDAAEQERNAKITADNAINEANYAISEAEQKMEKAEKLRKSAEQLKKNQKRLIQERAESLNDDFRLKWRKLIIILTVYSILSTFFMVCNSERCMNDISATVNFTKRLFTGIFERISVLADGAKGFSGLVAVLLVGVSVVTLYFNGKRLVNCYKQHCMDIVSLVVFLGCTAILTGFAELIPVNIVLLLIGSQAVYIFVRQRIEKIKLNE